jgi:alpha-L-fucosidase 2
VVDVTRGGRANTATLDTDLIELVGQPKHTYRAYALQKVRLRAPIEVSPGQTVKVSVSVRAIELPLVPSTTVSLVLPEGWTATPERATLPPIQPDTERTVDFDVTVGAAAAVGAVTLTAEALGRGWTASATVTTRVWDGREAPLPESLTNVGISDDANTNAGNLDGNGGSISAQALAQVGVTPGATVSHGGVEFTWPAVAVGSPDNAIASGQSIKVDGIGRTLGFLATGTYGAVAGSGTIVYADGTRQPFVLSTPDWYGAPRPGGDGAIVAPYQNRSGNQRQNTPATIYYVGVPLQDKHISRVDLPNISSRPAANVPTMHIFAIAVGG